MARTFRGYASAYSAHQTQPIRVRRSQIRTLVADFNGAIDVGRTITSVAWECIHPEVTHMSVAAVSADQRSVSVKVQFNFSGFGDIKATVTLDDGSQTNYEFTVDVTNSPLYPSTSYVTSNGPFILTASAA